MRSWENLRLAADWAVENADRCDWCGYMTGHNVAVPCELRAQMDPPVLIVSVICQDCAEAMQDTIAACRGEGEPRTCSGCGAQNDRPGKCWECGEDL